MSGAYRRGWAFVVVAALAAAAAWGQEGAGDEEGAREKVMALEREVQQLFAERKYEDAAAKCRAQIELGPSLPNPHYNLACALARFGHKDEALNALGLWREDASRFGGLVIDAAYPLDVAQYQQGKLAPFPLPTADAVGRVPIFALVGDQDGGHRLWKQVEEDWRKAGVPLRVDYVAGGRHEWLFGKPQLEALAAWLADVAAGKLPGAAPPPAPAPVAPPAAK